MKYIYTFLFIIFYQFAFGQSDTTLPKGIIKFSPINLVDIITPGIQVAFEKPLSKNRTVQFEVGFLSKVWDDEYFLGRDEFMGYRLKAEFRKYRYSDGFGDGFYLGGIVKWKQVFENTRSGWFWVHDNAYRQKLDYQRIASSTGVYFTLGQQWRFAENMTFDLGLALGLRVYYADYYGLPESAEFSAFGDFLDFDTGFYVFPSAYPTLKFGYLF